MSQSAVSPVQSGTASQTAKSSSNSSVSKDEFLKLLTYQLRAQNPMRPYDNQEFAAQLAQFSQLEQLTDIRSLLEEQVQTNLLLTQTISNTALPGMLGKTAKATSTTVHFDGSNPAEIAFKNDYPATSGEVLIKDVNGNVIRRITLDAESLKRGDHKISWDGTNTNGDTMGAGDYTVTVDMKDKSGAQVPAETFIQGKIEAVRFTSSGTILVIGGIEIPLQNVTDILTGS